MLKIRKTFKYRLYPNRKQRESLLATLEVCRDLYNDALQERREAWKLCRKSIPFAMQSAQLPACKAADAAMRGVYSQVLQDVLHRVDKTYKAFVRRGNGFPRFKGKGWFDSFTYPQAGFRVEGSQVSLSKIGNVKIKLHRPLAGEVKTLAWNASLSPAMRKSWTTHVGLVLPKRNCALCSATYPAAPSGLEAGVRRVGWLLNCIATYSTNATISSTSYLVNW